MTKLTNDEKIKNRKSRKILRIIIILSSLMVIVGAIYYLITKDMLGMILALIALIIVNILNKKRDSLEI